MAHDALKQAIAESKLPDGMKSKMLSMVEAQEVLPSQFFGAGLANLKLKVKKGLHLPQAEGPDRVYIAGEVVEPTFREALGLLGDYADYFEKA